jgi:hypothetical protein
MTVARQAGTGRRPPRFWAMFRRHSNAILALSIAILVASIAGVQLGQSAISAINPIHFQGAAPRPHGIDPAALRPAQPDTFATAYDWTQGYAAREADCGGNCDAREVRVAAAAALDPVRVGHSDEPYWRDATPVAEPAPWPPGATGSRGLSVERYMHYPVDEAEAAAEREAPADKPPPQDGEPADTPVDE